MEVNCAGCAGCCLDWRPLLESDPAAAAARDDAEGGTGSDADRGRKRLHVPVDRTDTEQGASREPLDDGATVVPLTRDEERAFLERGMAAALRPRFWRARDDEDGVEIDGHTLAAVAGRPVFVVGLRRPPKRVAPFGREEATWLPACVFLDPTTPQCRIHERELYPDECGAYPNRNLALEEETECERVEAAFGGERLLEATHDDPDGLLLGPRAIGAKLFCHPRPGDLTGLVDRAATGDLTRRDRAELIAVAAASSSGTLAISDHHYEWAKTRVLEAADDGSWVGPAIRDWHRHRRATGETEPSPAIADAIEVDRGHPRRRAGEPASDVKPLQSKCGVCACW